MKTREEKIIYTDGNGVKITDINFYTDDQTYLLEGIMDVRLIRKPASRWPGILMFLLGIIALLIGSFEVLENWRMTFSDQVYLVDASMVMMVSGVIFILAGVVLMVALRDHFAVRIRTAEGFRQPVKSKSREYIAHLVGQLKKSYHRYTTPEGRRIQPVIH